MAEQTFTLQVPDPVQVQVPVAAAPASMPNKGFMSSEFGTTITAGIAIALGVVPQQYAPLVAGLVGVYVACRTLLKAAHVLGFAKQIPDLPELPAGTVRQTVTTTEVK